MQSKEFYDNNGYVILKGFFSEETCNRISEKMRYWGDKEYTSIMNPDRMEYLIPQCFKNTKKYLTDNVDDIERAVETADIMKEIMLNSNFLEALNNITDKNNNPICSHYFFKQPGTAYAAQSWVPHQDNSWTKNDNNQLHLAHIALEKSTIDNGCIYLYAGSHKESLLPVLQNPQLLTEGLSPGRLIEVPEKYSNRKVDCVMDKGDVVICHGNTIHGSYANTSTRSRQSYAIHYIPENETFISGERARRKVIKRS